MCPSCVVDDEYIRLGGTSMAAPVVSGVAALLFQQHPDWTPEQVKATLVETARDVSGGVDEVNAAAATRRGTSRDGRRREHRAEHADRRDDRRDRLHALELGPLQLGPFELGRRRLGPLELGLHVRGLARRRARDDALELGRRGLAGPMGVLMQRASW